MPPEWELVEQIHSTIARLPHSHKNVQWIKGHQDDSTTDLSAVPAKFNVLADGLAATAHQTRILPLQCPVILPESRCSLFLHDKMISSQIKRALREAYTLPSCKQYVASRHRWDAIALEDVDWELFQRALTSEHRSPVQLVKFIYDKLPTNHELAKSNPHLAMRCSYCHQVETFYHLLQCSNSISNEFRTKIIKSFTTYCTKFDVPSDLD